MTNYWIVGATVSGQDMTRWFTKYGFWFGDKDTAQDDIAKIKKGDRIAIKRMRGRGAKTVSIKAVGVVEDTAQFNAMQFPMIFVKWISLEDEDKQVPFSALGGSIHGPYDETNQLVKSVFTLCKS